MAHFAGAFVGYRGWRPPLGRIGLPLEEWEKRIPSSMQVFQASAPDSYAAIQTFTHPCSVILLWAYTNAVTFQFSYDGTTWQDEIDSDPNRRRGGAYYMQYQAVGFRVKNTAPGAVGRYQIIPMW